MRAGREVCSDCRKFKWGTRWGVMKVSKAELSELFIESVQTEGAENPTNKLRRQSRQCTTLAQTMLSKSRKKDGRHLHL